MTIMGTNKKPNRNHKKKSNQNRSTPYNNTRVINNSDNNKKNVNNNEIKSNEVSIDNCSSVDSSSVNFDNVHPVKQDEKKIPLLLSSKLSLTNGSLVLSALILFFSSLKACSISLYFHIPMSELVSVSTVSEYIVNVLPCVLLCVFYYYAVKEINQIALKTDKTQFDEIKVKIDIGLYSVAVVLLAFVNGIICLGSDLRRMKLFNQYSVFSNILFPVCSFLIVVVTFVIISVIAYNKKANSHKQGKESSSDDLYKLFAFLICIVFGLIPFSIRLFYDTFLPLKCYDYEVTIVDNEPYVVICNNPKGKIAMTFSVDRDNTLIIDNSEYTYISSSNRDFMYCHFDSVRIESDNE